MSINKKSYHEYLAELCLNREAQKIIGLLSEKGCVSFSILLSMLNHNDEKAREVFSLIANLGYADTEISPGVFRMVLTPDMWNPIEHELQRVITAYENALLNSESEYSKELKTFVDTTEKYLQQFFINFDLSVYVVEVKTYVSERKSIVAELKLQNGTRVGQIKYRINDLAQYLGVKSVEITNKVSDLSLLGLEIPLPCYLCDPPPLKIKHKR